MKNWWKKYKRRMLGVLAYYIARFIGFSMRTKVKGRENWKDLKCGIIFVGWHGKSFVPGNYFNGKGVWALFSLSNDGEIQSRIFRKFGFRVIRGSTGRGGARALIESIKVLRNGDHMAITPDGPRGPAKVIQPGVLAMAQKSGAALVPVGSAATPATTIGTWDSYLVPWLFSKAAIVFGEPIFIPADTGTEGVGAIRVQVHEAIEHAERVAEETCGAPALPTTPATPALSERETTGVK